MNILSKDYTNEILKTNETWPIGTGPYKLVEYEQGEHIILERFDDYWKGTPDIKRVNCIILEDREELIDGLVKGELDIASIPFEYVDQIENTEGLTVESVQTVGVVYLSFDFRVNGSYGFESLENPTSDVRVRKAMYRAINITKLLEKISNTSAVVPVSQFVTQAIFGYNPNIERLSYDIEKATDLMREAGYDVGFTVELDCPDSNISIDLCKEISRQLSEINITVI